MPTIRKFSGIDNVSLPELSGDSHLQQCLNMYVDEKGALITRPGTTVIYPGDVVHSVFSAAGDTIFVGDSNLLREDNQSPDGYSTVEAAVGADAMRYLYINGLVYMANGTVGYTLTPGGSVRAWGVQIPTEPTLTASDGGSLRAGAYAVSLAYVRDDGSSSGASAPVEVEVEDNGSIVVSEIPTSTDPSVVGVTVYVTSRNGEALDNGAGMYAVELLVEDEETTTITDEPDTAGRKCTTLNAYPMPVPTVFCFYRGRMFCSVGATVFWSLPWAFELCELDRAHMTFPGTTVTNLMPVESGIWVTTDVGAFFVSFRSPQTDGGPQIKTTMNVESYPFGVTVNSTDINMRGISPGAVAVWVTNRGVAVGDAAGNVVIPTENFWRPTAAVTGGSTFLVDGTKIYAVQIDGLSMWITLANMSVTEHDIEVQSFAEDTSGSVMFAGGASFGALEGESDDGESFAFLISKEDIMFGNRLDKRFTDFYLDGVFNGLYNFSIFADGNESNVSVTCSDSRALKVGAPRGAVGARIGFQFDGESLVNGETRINAIEMLLDASQNRRSRAGHE